MRCSTRSVLAPTPTISVHGSDAAAVCDWPVPSAACDVFARTQAPVAPIAWEEDEDEDEDFVDDEEDLDLGDEDDEDIFDDEDEDLEEDEEDLDEA